MDAKAKKSGLGHRGRLVVLYCCLTAYVGLAVTNSILNLSTGIFSGQYGWNQADMISWNSYFGWLTIVFLMVIGQVLVKHSPRTMSVIVGAIYTVAVAVFPMVSQYWEYCALLGVISICNTLWMVQLNGVIISNWFPTKKGMAMGYVSLAMALGTGTGVSLFSALLESIGHTGVYLVFAAISALAVLLAITVVRDYPEQCGAFPDNDTSMTTEQSQAMLAEGMKAAQNSVWTVKNLLRTKETWMIGIALGTLPLFSGGVTSQMVPHMLALGFDQSFAVRMMALMSLCACVGSLVCGVIATKLGARKGMLIVGACAVIACLLNLVPSAPVIALSMAFVGMVLGGSSNFLVSTIASYWGRFGFTSAQRVVMPINQAVGSAGSVLIAQLAAVYSYNVAFVTVAAICGVGFLLILSTKEDAIMRKQRVLEEARGDAPAPNVPPAGH